MKLFARGFERDLRRAARKEIARSPELRRERRRVRPIRLHLDRGIPYPGACVLVFLAAIPISLAAPAHRDLAALALIVVATGCALERARALLHRLYRSPELSLLLTLPIDDEGLRECAWSGFRREAPWFVAAFMLAHVALLAPAGEKGGGVAVMAVAFLLLRGIAALGIMLGLVSLVPIVESLDGAAGDIRLDLFVFLGHLSGGALSGLLALALAAAIAAFRPRWATQRGGRVLLLFGVLLPILRAWVGPIASTLLPVAGALLPSGWILQALEVGLRRGRPEGLFWLLPAVGVVAMLPTFARRACAALSQEKLRQRLRFSPEVLVEHMLDRVADARARVDPVLGDSPAGKAWLREEARRSLEDVFEQRVRQAPFAPRLDWSRLDGLERIVGRWLTDEERFLAESLLVRPPTWGSKAGIGLVLAVISGVLLLGTHLTQGAGRDYLLFFGCGGVLCSFLFGVILDTNWPGLRWLRWGTSTYAAYTRYPIPFRSVLQILANVYAVRLLAFLPALALMMAAAGWGTGAGVLLCMEIGAATVALLAATIPLCVAIGLATKIPRSPGAALQGCGVLLGLACLIVALPGLGIFVLAMVGDEQPGAALAGFLPFAFLAWIGARAVERYHQSRCVDHLR